MLTKKSLVIAAALTGILVVGGAVAPAAAITGDATLIAITGHVTDRDGEPIAGVHASVSCLCGSYGPPFVTDEAVTSSTGYYSLRASRIFASTLHFSDPGKRYFGKAGKLTAVSGGYVSNPRLARTSTISGTITAVNGALLSYTTVLLYDAVTGKGRGNAAVRSDGSWTSYVKPGSYKVRFSRFNYYVNDQWYGGVSKAASPVVTVGYAGAVSGIDATVTPKPTISGTITVDGHSPLTEVRENVVVTIADVTGKQVGKMVTRATFSFVSLAAGTYTIAARPSHGSDPYVQPVRQTVELAPNTAINGLTLSMTSTSATSASTRSSGISFAETSTGVAAAGKLLTGKIIVSSYGTVAGGTALIYVDGKRVDARVLPASGRLNWRYRPAKVVIGGFHPFTVKVRFLGTETARARSVIVYALGGD